MKIYFAGAIRGNREHISVFQKIVSHLQKLGHKVMTEHVAHVDVLKEESKHTNETIYSRDYKWLMESEILVAEVSGHSTGVGLEIGFALKSGIKVYGLYRRELEQNVSKMILGCPEIIKIAYSNEEELLKELDKLSIE